jgi:diacylglycerol kinase (ATP)
MTAVGVIAHSGKTLGGGLPELRRTLEQHGVRRPFWAEVPKSRKAPKHVRRALEAGVGRFFIWGGDGTLQRCLDVLAGTDATVAIVPAGTANLLASNLGIPKDIEAAVRIGMSGPLRAIDVASMNGERFAVMAGAGFDARMIRAAAGGLKDRLGRLAYIWTGSASIRRKPFRAKIDVDGSPWFHGEASCVLAGNVGALFGGVEVFADARPDDGMLDLGVVTADGAVQWARTVARTLVASASRSPFLHVTKARSVEVRLSRKVLYELDGGDREKVRSFRLEVEPGAVRLRVPPGAELG